MPRFLYNLSRIITFAIILYVIFALIPFGQRDTYVENPHNIHEDTISELRKIMKESDLEGEYKITVGNALDLIFKPLPRPRHMIVFKQLEDRQVFAKAGWIRAGVAQRGYELTFGWNSAEDRYELIDRKRFR